MTAWRNLPTELTAVILQSLDLQKDIVNTLAVCHQFRDLLEPALYKAVSISDLSDDDYGGDKYGTKTPRLLSLLRTIAVRPELGRLIQSLSFGWLWGSRVEHGIVEMDMCNRDYSAEEREEQLSSWGMMAADLGIVISAAAQKGLPNGLALKGGRGHIVLLLHYLPNLASLSFDCGHDLATIALAALGRFKGGVPAGLQSITALTLSYDDTEMGFSTKDVVPFFSLPALSEFRVFNCAADGWASFFPAAEGLNVEDGGGAGDEPNSTMIIHSRSSSVTHLSFEHSAMDCDVLNRVLELPHRLVRFHYDLGGPTVGGSPFVPSAFYRGLCVQAGSLVELFITDTTNSGEFDAEDGSVLGSLRAFTALTHVRMHAQLLLGRRPAPQVDTRTPRSSPLDALLPPSLITLELELGQEYTLPHFIAITGVPNSLTRTSQELPNLRRFHLGAEGVPRIQLSDEASETRMAVASLIRTCEARSPYGHQINLKAGSPYFYMYNLPIP